MTISSATRVLQALNHQEPEHVPFDLGGTRVTTIHVTAYQNLRRYLAVLADKCLSWPNIPIHQAARRYDGLSCDCQR